MKQKATLILFRVCGLALSVAVFFGWRCPAQGCPACKGVGFRGRVPIAEAFLTNDALLRAVADRRPAAEIARLAHELGLASMAADGLDKALRGETTLEEVMGAVHD